MHQLQGHRQPELEVDLAEHSGTVVGRLGVRDILGDEVFHLPLLPSSFPVGLDGLVPGDRE